VSVSQSVSLYLALALEVTGL